MPAKNIYIPNKVRKKTLSYPPRIKQRIAKALITIKENPLVGNKLKGELDHLYKYRIGDYRIVYSFNQRSKIIYILKIEHRQGVYK